MAARAAAALNVAPSQRGGDATLFLPSKKALNYEDRDRHLSEVPTPGGDGSGENAFET
jgi:hypothetical protein